jgi:hypothetical protein
MLVRSNRARDIYAVSGFTSQVKQMVDRRLAIAQTGLAEVQRHLAAGQAEDARIVLGKIDEDLHLLRCRLNREAEISAPRPPVLLGSAN